ncbi:MAG: HEAT repeat domain-containing protein, partial [Planctomycetota bacterium]
MRLGKNVFKFFVILAAVCIMLPVPSISAPAAGELKAVASCSADAVRAGELVVVELSLQNVSDEEITYVDFKTNFFLDEIELTTLLVDGRLVCMHTLLDVNDDGYKVIAEHKPDNVATEGGVVSYTPLPIPREAFVVLKPGEKVAYLKVDLQPAQFIHERRKGVLGPLHIPGEHTIQVEYHNRAHGRQFGLNAWTGNVRSNVVTVRVKPERLLEEVKPEVSNLLSKLEKLEDEHLKIRKEKWDTMSDAEKRGLITYNGVVMSGLEGALRTLSEKTARRIMAFGEPAVPILLEELAVLSSEIHYLRRCIARSLRQIGQPAIPYLIEAFQAGGPGDKVALGRYKNTIISTLGEVKDTRAVEPLLDSFQGPRAGSVLHTHAIATALGLIGDKRAVEPIIGALEDCLEGAENTADWDKEGYHMRIFVEALGRLGDSRAVPVLKKALNSGPQKTKGGTPYYLVAEEAARALRSLGVQVEGEDGKYRIVTDPPEEDKPGRVLFSDGRELVGKVFVQGGKNEWQRIERVEQQLKITCRDGRTRSESVYTKDPLLEKVFVKTRDGWRPPLGELWPSLDSNTLSRTYIKEIIFGEKPSESEQQEFHEYRHKYYRDSSERQWGAHWAKLSRNMPPSWEKLPTSKQQCYRNLAMIKWASYYAWNKPVPVTGDVNLIQLFGWRYLDSPVCPTAGEYSTGSTKTWADPTCSVHGSLTEFKPETKAHEAVVWPRDEALLSETSQNLGTATDDSMPQEAKMVFDEYLQCVKQRDAESLKQLLCFNDKRDKELFIAFSSSGGKIYVRPELFPYGKPVEQKKAADDCWIVVLEDGHLLELWKVDGKWKVLCPVSGKKRMAVAKLTRAEMWRYLFVDEIRQVQSESDIQLERRRQRYLAVLDLSRRHQIKRLAYYFSGMPINDPAVLSKMSIEQFREAVILKLDSPDGVRYRVDPEQKALLEGKPVFVVFSIENVTSGTIILEYRPAVEIVDFSNAITARGALVFPRGEKTTDLMISPFRGKLAYPLKERELEIAPGATFTMRMDLLEYYDLPAARYTISSRIDIDNAEQGYWRGHALSDTTRFEIMPLSASGPPDPNTATIAGKVIDTATGKGVAGIPVVLGGRAVTTTLPDGTYRATNVAPGPTSVGARDRDWYIVPYRRGAISAYYGRVQYEKVNLEAGKETHLDIQVTKGGKIKGTVWDMSGKAVPRTIIWIVNQQENSIVAAKTGEFGDYTSYGLAPDIPLELLVWTSDGRGSARRTITLEAGEIHEADFILDAENEYRIVGKVSDSSGRGVPNLSMRCSWRKRNRRHQRTLRTDGNGDFCFSGLEPDMEYEVYASGKSAGFDTVNKSVRMPANERTVPLYFYLQKREEEPAAAAIYKKEDVSVGAESYELRVSRILQRLYTAMEKAYADVGLSKEDIQGLLSRQPPPQKAIGKWKSYQETWPAIVKARNAAIEEMASLGPSAVTVLLEAKDKSNERRGGDIFVSAITKIGKTVVPALIDGLSHVDVLARARAATSLGRMRDKRAVKPLIRSLSDPDKRVVGAAVRSLGRLKDIAATEPLMEMWHKGQVVSRTSIASALGQIGEKRAAEPIMAALEECVSKAQQTGNWDMNSWAMRVYAGALGQIGDPQAIGLLKKMLDAPHQRTKALKPVYLVADAAARALRSLGLEVTGDREKGGYKLVETVLNTGVE